MENFFSAWIILITLFVLAVISFFFSASETAIIGLSKIRLHHLVNNGVKHAQSVQRIVTKLDKFITAILVGNNFVNIAVSSIITVIFVQFFGYRWGVVLATFVTAFFILILCEVTPKILAIKHAEKIALLISPFMELILKIFDPVFHIFTTISNSILRIFGIEASKRAALITEEELRTMIEIGKEEGVLTDQERKMLHRIFEFGDTRVSEVMAPKDKIVAVNVNASAEEVLDIFSEEGHARLPVYEGSSDNMIGIIYARDLVYILRDKGLFLIRDLLRDAYFVPGSCRVNELLKAFQAKKLQIAIVVDENKKTLGLVTLEDLLEEIVGEIEAEPRLANI